GAAAGLPEHANQAMTASPVEQEIEGECGEERNDQTDAQLNSRRRDSMADEKPEPNPRSGPRQSAHGTVTDEAGDPHLRGTGQTGSDRAHLRQEPGAELKCPSVGGE